MPRDMTAAHEAAAKRAIQREAERVQQWEDFKVWSQLDAELTHRINIAEGQGENASELRAERILNLHENHPGVPTGKDPERAGLDTDD